MPGSVADNLPWASACAFAPRCARVVDACTSRTPEGEGDLTVGHRCFDPAGGAR